MSQRELSDWSRFDAQRPLPDEAADLHNAMLCCVASNLMRDPDAPPATVDQFRLYRPPVLPLPPVEGARHDLSDRERLRMLEDG